MTEECLDARHDEPCDGTIEFRMPLSGTGKSFPRCDRHWDIRLTKHEIDQERYPDSPLPPSWFDQADVGERWEDD